jgi:abortive infection bacteriophage resistance protein
VTHGGTFYLEANIVSCKPPKPALSLAAQVELLKSRGLIVNDTTKAIKILSAVNYYRLSAYSLGLRKDDIFFEGTTFEQIYQLYEFDTKLRHVLVSAIEIIEIKFRTKIAYYLAMEHDPMSYLDTSLFKDKIRHETFVAEFEREKERQKGTAFVKHYIDLYNGEMPMVISLSWGTRGTVLAVA